MRLFLSDTFFEKFIKLPKNVSDKNNLIIWFILIR